MQKYKLGDHLNIHSYKHDSKIHRSWDEATYLNEDEEYMIFGNQFTSLVNEMVILVKENFCKISCIHSCFAYRQK